MIKGIVAMDRQGAIGYRNSMPWGDRPLDGKHFQSLTQGHIVVMGRKTFESIGNRPLPHRLNVVLTRTPPPKTAWTENLQYASSIEEVLGLDGRKGRDVWIIGGSEVYQVFLPYIQEMYVTLVEHEFDHADTYFPDIHLFGEWTQEVIGKNENGVYVLTFYRYKRNEKGFAIIG